jgi:hypothetical protein
MSEETKVEKVRVTKHEGGAGVLVSSASDDSREQTVDIDHVPARTEVTIERETKGEEDASV